LFEEFDKYLEGDLNDHWYDDGVLIAEEMLKDFSEEDWFKLSNELLNKPLQWQIKYAYCVEPGINDDIIIDNLLSLISLDDEELIVTSIDSLRCIFEKDRSELIIKNKMIVMKIQKLIPEVGIATQKILIDFLNKLS